jgi:hypothetical protein
MGEHIRHFKNRQDEARSWDETGVDRLSPDEYEEVKVTRPERPLSSTFAIRFEPRTVALLRQVARAYNRRPTQLARDWVLERLQLERSVGVLAEPTGRFPIDFERTLRAKIVDSLFSHIPAAADAALQEVLDRADQEADALQNMTD